VALVLGLPAKWMGVGGWGMWMWFSVLVVWAVVLGKVKAVKSLVK